MALRATVSRENLIEIENHGIITVPQNFEPAPVVDGRFKRHKKTYKELVITRINTIFCIILGVLIMVSVISYYITTSNEMQLNQLRKETILLNDENIELQNHLDYLKSFHNVDKSVKEDSKLQTAEKIIEVSSSEETTPSEKTQKVKFSKDRSKSSFSWSLGY